MLIVVYVCSALSGLCPCFLVGIGLVISIVFVLGCGVVLGRTLAVVLMWGVVLDLGLVLLSVLCLGFSLVLY